MRIPRQRKVDDAELAALADGSLRPERVGGIGARVASSPELSALLAEQRRAVALMRGAAAGVEAPSGLRTRLEAQSHAPVARRRRR